MKTKIFFVVLLAVLLPLALFAKDIVPAGWRAPTAQELGGDSDWRDEDPHKYLVARADFDGDGKVDTARLLIHSTENRIGLFVTMSSGKGTHTLEIIGDRKQIEWLGMSVVEPGVYDTACGKGLWECKAGEPKQLHLRHPAIDFFKAETEEFCYWWNAKKKKFEKTAISD